MRLTTAAALFLAASLYPEIQPEGNLCAGETQPAERIQVQQDAGRFVSRVTLTAQNGRIALSDVLRGVARVQGYDDNALDGTLPNLKVKLNGRVARSLLSSSERLFGDGVHFAIRQPQTARAEPQLVIQMDHQALLASQRRIKQQLRETLIPDSYRGNDYGIHLHERSVAVSDSERLVIFIHGLNSHPQTVRRLCGLAQENGLACAEFNYPNDQAIDASGQLLAAELQRWKRQHPQQRISLVTHSMGGLVARTALEDPQLDPGNVDQLIMVAPPNQGCELAQFAFGLDLWEYMDGRELRENRCMFYSSIEDGLSEATVDLEPGSIFLTKLNRRERNSRVRYSVFLGTGAPCTQRELDKVRARIAMLGRVCPWAKFLGSRVDRPIADLDEVVRGKGDGAVAVKRGRLPGVEDTHVLGFGHLNVLYDHEGSRSQTALRGGSEAAERRSRRADRPAIARRSAAPPFASGMLASSAIITCMGVPLAQFEKSLSESGLLSADELQAFRENLDPSQTDSHQLAESLVAQKRLTPFQAERLLAGQADGLVFDEYVIVDKIGSGGMGDVFKARHRKMKRYVAVKAISPKAVGSPQAVQRFLREVEAAAQLEHPNIVTAHDAREVNGRHYLIMQYVQGEDLSSIVRRQGTLSVAQAIDVILQTARGLEYAHSRGIIHRDIKPGNLLLAVSSQQSAVSKEGKAGSRPLTAESCRVKILDMGLARIDHTADEDEDATADIDLTHTGQVMGTADYMAPEQGANTRNADERSDIYSLGCTLFRLLAGKAAYQGETIVEKILAHTNEPIPSLIDNCPQLAFITSSDATPSPDDSVALCLEKIYRQMLSKKPSDRQQSMGEVIEQLEGFVALQAETEGSFTHSTALWPLSEALGSAPSSTDLETQLTIQSGERTGAGTPTGASASSPSRATPKSSSRAWLIAGGVALLALAILGVFTAPYWLAETDEGTTSQPEQGGSTNSGAVDFALKFDGKTSFVELPTLRYDDTSAITIEASIRADEDVGPGYVVSLGGDCGVFLKTQSKDRSLFWVSGVVDERGVRKSVKSTQLDLGQRVHLAAVWDEERWSLFVDGRESEGELVRAIEQPLMLGAHNGFLGKAGFEAVGEDHYAGSIDEVRISSVARYREDFTPPPTPQV